jgi:hypothetical protein
VRRRLDLAYLGTHFEGWQAQDGPRPVRTVQGELETALATMHGVPIRVHGTSRTDTGVHAEGQVAHFDVPEGAPAVPPEGLRRGLNTLLPATRLAASAVDDAFTPASTPCARRRLPPPGRCAHPIHGLNAPRPPASGARDARAAAARGVPGLRALLGEGAEKPCARSSGSRSRKRARSS